MAVFTFVYFRGISISGYTPIFDNRGSWMQVSGQVNPLACDLDHVIEHTRDLWEELRGERLFITGGTGFFGRWLLESLLWANRTLNLRLSVVVLTRHAADFDARLPHLARDPALSLHRGNVRTFSYPTGNFSHIIHAATPVDATLNREQPLEMLDTMVEGTRRVLDFAAGCGARRLLLTSSGAVYGRQPSGMRLVPESWNGVPDTMSAHSAYAEGKRMSELLCTIYGARHGIEMKIARCFSFTGPGLPLDTHFAMGNFIRDGLAGGPVRVGGDGTPWRSYLYAADLAIWLWTILITGESCRPYNVGSDHDLTILELASLVANIGEAVPVEIAAMPTPGAAPERYVPDIGRARRELKLDAFVPLPDAIRRTMAWAAAGGTGR